MLSTTTGPICGKCRSKSIYTGRAVRSWVYTVSDKEILTQKSNCYIGFFFFFRGGGGGGVDFKIDVEVFFELFSILMV